jgi:hypothetical protein
MAKKKCNSKCSKKTCGSKKSTIKKSNNKLQPLDNPEIVLQPKSKTNYFYGLIKKAFGYD